MFKVFKEFFILGVMIGTLSNIAYAKTCEEKVIGLVKQYAQISSKAKDLGVYATLSEEDNRSLWDLVIAAGFPDGIVADQLSDTNLEHMRISCFSTIKVDAFNVGVLGEDSLASLKPCCGKDVD
jgi:hypothetical protein